MNEEERLENLALILEALGKATGEDLRGNSFNSRLRIQKSIYLLKNLGYKPLSDYSFSNNLRGPYSPNLADHYYKADTATFRLAKSPKIPASMVDTIKKALTRGLRFTEAATTLHSTWKHNKGLSKEAIFSHVRKLKPYLGGELEGAWKFLEEAELVPGCT